MKPLSLFVLIHLLSVMIQAQPSQVIPPIGESARQRFDLEQHDLSCNERQYRLYIAQPKSQVPESRPAGEQHEPRPVLYMLDGNGQFPVLLNLLQEVTGETPVIVGIGYPSTRAFPKERTRDYTFPVDDQPGGGGAGDFYRFLTERVKPLVETRYNVDTTRQTLCGHSHGGLFTLFVAFNHTRAFQHYVAGSPSLWWGDGAIIPGRSPLFETVPRSITITITWGEYEENPSLDPARKKLSPGIQRIKEQRKSTVSHRELAALIAREVSSCRPVVFEGKNHGSSVPGFLMEAFRVAGGE